MREDSRLLLDEITHCPVLVSCKSGQEHPCSRVVDAQRDLALADHQVPEPWSGRLDEALVLFITTSPAIARGEDYAVWSDPPEAVAGYFQGRFGDGPRSVLDGVYPPIPGRHSTTPLQSWVELKARAAELVPAPVPGVDYAVTYAVHCRTEGELGVRRAVAVCPERYLRRLVAAAARARVLVVVGPHAATAVHGALGLRLRDDVRHLGPVPVEGLHRHVVFLDHFGGYGAIKEVAAAVDDRTLETIRHELAALRSPGADDSSPAAEQPRATQLPSFSDVLPSLQSALLAMTTSYDAGEAAWLAANGRLADAALSRVGWLLQSSLGAHGLDVTVLTNPTGLVVARGRRALLMCDYAVVPADRCRSPIEADELVDRTLQRAGRGDPGSCSLAALAVSAPVAGDGTVDTRALHDAAMALIPRLRTRADVHGYRVGAQDARPEAYLDVYLVDAV